MSSVNLISLSLCTLVVVIHLAPPPPPPPPPALHAYQRAYVCIPCGIGVCVTKIGWERVREGYWWQCHMINQVTANYTIAMINQADVAAAASHAVHVIYVCNYTIISVHFTFVLYIYLYVKCVCVCVCDLCVVYVYVLYNCAMKWIDMLSNKNNNYYIIGGGGRSKYAGEVGGKLRGWYWEERRRRRRR